VETNATRMCALVVGLPDVTVLGVEDRPVSGCGCMSRPPPRSSAAPVRDSGVGAGPVRDGDQFPHLFWPLDTGDRARHGAGVDAGNRGCS
jgi:hypothetical protein